MRIASATRIAVSTFGVLVALAGIEHGIGAILQGPVRPETLAFESWADAEAFEMLSGEPAMTVIPNLLVTGILASSSRWRSASGRAGSSNADTVDWC